MLRDASRDHAANGKSIEWQLTHTHTCSRTLLFATVNEKACCELNGTNGAIVFVPIDAGQGDECVSFLAFVMQT